jgi:uracil-DNA glycosylase
MPVTNEIKLNPSWFKILKRQFEMPYFLKLSDFIKREYLSKKIYPHPKNIFRAMDLCPFDEVKVVIVGQDPYHNEGQADGLCFSVPDNIKIPPSLCNIFKEIETDLNIKTLKSGDLSRWAKQGVLLLNSTLTVVKNSPASHKGLGWEVFTDEIIKSVSDKKENIVFILWGNFAKSKKNLIDKDKHLILESAHPSPFSVSGFLGCKHFSKTNNFLQKKGLSAINWQ